MTLADSFIVAATIIAKSSPSLGWINSRRVGTVAATSLSCLLLLTSSHSNNFHMTASALSTATVVAPSSRMELSESLRQAETQKWLYDAQLIPLVIPPPTTPSASDGTSSAISALAVKEETESTISLQQAARRHASGGKVGSIIFVVRRPGCVLCREHGQQLSELAAKSGEFGFWGVIKETGVDDLGLSEFYHNHYTFPLYRDAKKVTYQALGNRSILSLSTWNPWKLWQGYRSLSQRLSQKKLEGNLKGEGFTQGGIFVFDAQGMVRFAYPEETGSPLQMDDLQEAMQQVVNDPLASAKDEL